MSRVVVIKLGGTVLEDSAAISRLAAAVVSPDVNVLIVHGGGSLVQARLSERGVVTDKIDGLRVTGDDALATVVGVLAGEANAALVSALVHEGVRAAGVMLGSWGVLSVEPHDDERLGRVGQISINAEHDGTLIRAMWDAGVVPVVSSIGAYGGGLLNVNADDAAAGLAAVVEASAMVMVSDVDGVLDVDGQVVEQLGSADAAALIESGVASGGMVAKLNAALSASAGSGCAVWIGGVGAAASVLGGGASCGTVVRVQSAASGAV